MPKGIKRLKGDIAWYLPNKKKPFTYSSTSTRDLIMTLYEKYKDLAAVYENINFDYTAKLIVKTYIDSGIYHCGVL